MSEKVISITSGYAICPNAKGLDSLVSMDALVGQATRVELAERKPKNAYNEDLKTTLYNFQIFYEGSKKVVLIGLPDKSMRPLNNHPEHVRQDWSTDDDSMPSQNIRALDSFMHLVQRTVCEAHGVPASRFKDYPVKFKSLAEDGSEVVYFKKPRSTEKYTFDLDKWQCQEGVPLFKIATIVVVEPAMYSRSSEKYIKVTFDLCKDFHTGKKRAAPTPTVYASEADEQAAKKAKQARLDARKSAKDKLLDQKVAEIAQAQETTQV